MAQTRSMRHPLDVSPALAGPRPRRATLATLVKGALAARRQRLALARLDAHLLDDIGIDPGAAWSEVRRPFWELPERHHW